MAAALIIVVLVLIIAVLTAKIILLRSAADAIAQQFDDRLRADTNTPITLSCRDAYMRQLASAINDALRELRRQRLRYENGDRALKTAVTNISHDLRTPLTAIRGTLDLLEREDASPNTRRHLAIIANRTDAMTQLCEELFRYSVILADDTPHPPSAVCLNDALAESLAGFYGAFQQRSLTPDIRLCDEAVWRTSTPTLWRASLTTFSTTPSNTAMATSLSAFPATPSSPLPTMPPPSTASPPPSSSTASSPSKPPTMPPAWACPSPARWWNKWAAASAPATTTAC